MLACPTAMPITEEEAPFCYLCMLGTDKEKKKKNQNEKQNNAIRISY